MLTYGASSVVEVCLSSASTLAALSFTPHRSSISLAVSRLEILAAVNVAAAAATPGPNAPAGTPSGSSASVRHPH